MYILFRNLSKSKWFSSFMWGTIGRINNWSPYMFTIRYCERDPLLKSVYIVRIVLHWNSNRTVVFGNAGICPNQVSHVRLKKKKKRGNTIQHFARKKQRFVKSQKQPHFRRFFSLIISIFFCMMKAVWYCWKPLTGPWFGTALSTISGIINHELSRFTFHLRARMRSPKSAMGEIKHHEEVMWLKAQEKTWI